MYTIDVLNTFILLLSLDLYTLLTASKIYTLDLFKSILNCCSLFFGFIRSLCIQLRDHVLLMMQRKLELFWPSPPRSDAQIRMCLCLIGPPPLCVTSFMYVPSDLLEKSFWSQHQKNLNFILLPKKLFVTIMANFFFVQKNLPFYYNDINHNKHLAKEQINLRINGIISFNRLLDNFVDWYMLPYASFG